jgi:glucose/arabinose dehydrogenase
MSKFAIGGLVVLALVAGYFGYQYVKEKPPKAVIELFTATPPPPPLPAGPEAPFFVPDGFRATIYARDVPSARVLIRDQAGTLLLSQTKEGKVVALPDADKDGAADEVVTILEGLREPHGMHVRCDQTDGCVLYVAETNALRSYTYDPATFKATEPQLLLELPSGEGHFTRTLLPHTDGKRLLIAVGSSCNVCNEENKQRASVLAYDFQTKETSTFADGLRNTVFLAEHPATKDIWGTENGRDLIGDDIPPDEINKITEGENYGWPYCYGKKVVDVDFSGTRSDTSCEQTEASFIDLPAHAAALGLAFIPAEGWPAQYQGDLLVALHGSWNRSAPSGYKVIRIPLDQNGNIEGQAVDFMTGFIEEGAADGDDALGRPVGVLAEADGRILISDDKAGAVYLVSLND